MERGDIIVAYQDRQRFLVQVQDVASNTIHGFLAKDYHIPYRRTPIELVAKDVVVNLGKRPHPGSVYGLEVAHHAVTKHHDDFGQVSFLYYVRKEVGASMMTAFSVAAKALKKHKLDFLLHAGVWEVMSPELGGMYAGKYKHSKMPDKNPHRFLIRPEKMPASEFPYVIFHELGHHMRFAYVTEPKVMSKWVVEFNTSIKLAKISKELSRSILSKLIAGATPPSRFAGELDTDEDKLAYRQILRVIKMEHAVGVRELDALYESSNFEEIESLWPLRTLNKKELAPIVSEYACTSAEELFAESFAFYLSGKKLPKRLHALMEKTISYARKQSDRQEQ